jgi:hypothetical protein
VNRRTARLVEGAVWAVSPVHKEIPFMPQVLGAAFVVGLLAWSAVGGAALSEEHSTAALATPPGLQLARGGGSAGHAAAMHYAREKSAEKAEVKREAAIASDEAKDSGSGKKKSGDDADATDAPDPAERESELRPLPQSH